ncbi:MAG: hydrogenase maturation nickel metallochaperone HypA [Nitrospirota bacterium]|nr:hydrogenase maturation nickel metallochaperone HypA [Nitrospirota bacterium]MDH5586034.1 hydrogenase maturation nickel metallochaperone HypA [Nitrospirota bacterium]MDH5773317.1 hydrogenase maturation nickel metallochaperone HypA [Nitrospirota bacterium]
MHELQLLKEVVRQVEERCQTQPGNSLSRIRLEIDSHSHLASHTPEELQATFHFAAQGTPVDSANLDIHVRVSTGTCQSCEAVFDRAPETYGCPHCFSGDIAWEDHPELIITDIEFVEREP